MPTQTEVPEFAVLHQIVYLSATEEMKFHTLIMLASSSVIKFLSVTLDVACIRQRGLSATMVILF